MAEYNHIAYMLEVAEKSKDILHTTSKPHFHRISGLVMLEEFLANISNIAPGFHLLAEEDLNGQFIGDDNPLDRSNYMFFIVKQVKPEDHNARQQVKRDCKAVIKKIVGRMRKHWREAQKVGDDAYGLRNFDTENILYQTIGPIGDNCFGIECRFSIIEKAGTTYDNADWNE